jgi:TP901 family phage tail tape measure protein
MADENIVTNIVANADFSGLIADVNKVAASLSKLQAQIIQSDARLASQVATMNRSFGENLRRTGQFATHFVTLTSDVEKFGTNLDKGQMKLKQYFQTFQQHTKTQGGLIRDLAKQQVALQNAIIQPMGKNAQGLMQYSVHIPQGLDAIKNKTALAKQELQIMNKVIQDGGVQMINWGKNTQWAGRQLTVGLTVPLAAFGKAAADAFRAADAELVRLTKVYGGVAATSAADLSKIRNEVSATAKDIAKAYGVSFKDTITLAADIAATGKQGNELLASVKETSRLAVLGEVDRQDAMKATLAIQNTFKQNTDQLSESINFLNAVENQTSTSLADLIEAIPKAGPVIQGMGGSVKDLALYLTAMKEGGINAAEGANALKSALASLINPTKVATEKFSSMGIDLGGIVSKNAGNLTGTILELQKALDNLDPLQKQQAIEQLFGKFQFARMNALFANLGKQGSQTLQVLDLMKASSQELAGVAGRELGMVTESASGKYRRALEGLKADLAGMGEEFLKIQTFFINVTDSIVKFVGHLPGPIKTILTFVTGLTAIIGPVIMLTGVLANFFGYIIKGASHFKSLFKGGEGWKMLTPEILAAQKAGSLVEQTFYSDAKAATVLKTAIAGLVTEFELLQSKAMTGAVSAGPTISTMAGNVVTPGGGRVVNPNHPLISAEDTRSMSHLNPVAGMSTDAKAAQTIFGVVPGAPKVNQKIGNNPQMYMSGDLPKIPGLTSIGGASTGIVAEEAAKWHAMTGALAMQSTAEIELLKKEVLSTGLITTELSDSYQALLPTMTKLTANAATESAAIVAQLQAGKITVDQARLKIIELNAQVETMIAQASTDIAGQQGRSIGLTTVPLLNQPVVNKDGKTNMKELTRPGRTRDLLNKIARNLGVKTFGAGYSTETTIPKRFATGGVVYRGDGSDGPEFKPMGTDTIPAMLTEGEFVVNAEATKQNLPLLQAINSQSNSELPIGYMPSKVSDSVLGIFGERPRSRGSSSPGTLVGRWGMIMPETINGALAQKLNSPGALGSDLLALLQQPDRLIDLEDFLSYNGVDPKDIDVVKRRVAADMASKIQPNAYYADGGFGQIAMSSTQNAVSGLESKYPGISLKFQKDRMTPGRRDTLRRTRAGETQAQANARGGGSPTGINYKNQRPSNYGAGAARGSAFGPNQVWGHFGDQEMQKNTSMLSRAFGFARRTPNLMAIKNVVDNVLPRGRYTPGAYKGFNPIRRNMGGPVYMTGGGMVPGYSAGGMVPSTQYLAKGSLGALRSTIRGTGTVPGMNGGMDSGAASMAGFGLMMGGQMMPNQDIGMGMQFAGMAMQMAPLLKMLKPLVSGFGSVGSSVAKLGTIAKTVFTAMRIALAALLTPAGAVVAVVTALGLAIYKNNERLKENAKEQSMLHSVTKKGAEQAGISYNNISDSIKNVKNQLELARAAQENAFNAQNSSGVAGLTLTIKELQEKISSAKTEMSEFVDVLNNLDQSAEKNSKMVAGLAANWKATWVAGGKSAQDATNQIYAIIKASDMANQAFEAITTGGFKSITDRASALSFIFKDLNKSMSKMSGEDLGNALGNLVTGLDSAVNALADTKDAAGNQLGYAKAMEETLKNINSIEGAGTKIKQSQIEDLKKTHPQLAKILNTTDDIRSVYAKWKILTEGLNVNLKTLTATEAEALARFIQLENQIIAASEKGSGVVKTIGKSGAAIKTLNAAILAGGVNAEKNAARTKEQIDAEIKAIDKRMKKYQEEADARIKAIQKTQSAESYAVELKQAQLDLQAAIASGDKEAQVRAQLSLSRLQKERESEMAILSIKDDVAAKDAAENKRKEALQAEKDRIDKTTSSAQSKAANITIARDKVLGFQQQYETILKRQNANERRAKDDPTKAPEATRISKDLSTLSNDIAKAAAGSDKDLTKALKDAFAGTLIDAKTFQSEGGKMTTGPDGKPLYKTGDADAILKSDSAAMLKELTSIDSHLANLEGVFKGTGSGTSKDPYQNGSLGDIYKANPSFKPKIGGALNPGLDPSKWNQPGLGGLLGAGSARSQIKKYAEEQGFQAKQFFTIDHNNLKYKFRVEDDGNITMIGKPVVIKKSLGGPFAAGQLIEVNDRINPLGGQQEGMLIRPDFSGVIYPNAATMPKYDIPSGGYRGSSTTSSLGSGGSAPVINNYITAAPNMDIKQLAREVGIVTAKAVSRGGNNRGYSNGTQQVVNV